MFESIGIVTGFEDVAVVSNVVKQGGGHLGIVEYGILFAERQVGGDDQTGLLVKAADQMEEQCPTGLRER